MIEVIMGDPAATTWPRRRRRKSRRKGPSAVALLAFLAFVLVAAVSGQFFGGRRGRSFLRAPLSALGANLMRGAGRRWPSNPNRSGLA